MFVHIQTADDHVCLGSQIKWLMYLFPLWSTDCDGFPPALQRRVASVRKKKKNIWLREFEGDYVLQAAGHALTVGCGRQQLLRAGPASSEEKRKGKPKPLEEESDAPASFPRQSGAKVWQTKDRIVFEDVGAHWADGFSCRLFLEDLRADFTGNLRWGFSAAALTFQFDFRLNHVFIFIRLCMLSLIATPFFCHHISRRTRSGCCKHLTSCNTTNDVTFLRSEIQIFPQTSSLTQHRVRYEVLVAPSTKLMQKIRCTAAHLAAVPLLETKHRWNEVQHWIWAFVTAVSAELTGNIL